jgi:phosphoribosylformimino-5-aminoimidazole carboxamide ribotide isomerase
MIFLPAIDLVGGRCVRLAQGDFDRETDYSTDPATALDGFAASGVVEAHLVDLDGARARAPRQHELFATLAANSSLELQVAGGFRMADQVGLMLDAGIKRVVIGSLALDDPAAFDGLLNRFGADRLVLALDVRLDGAVPMIATHGWTTDSGQSLDTVLARFGRVRHLLVTDIARDGMLSGPNLPLMRAIAHRHPQIKLQASGGVAQLDDLARLDAAGATRVIVGKAIWEGRFSVAEGVARARD